MSNIYIFGVSSFAELLKYYIETYSGDPFMGFVADKQFIPENGRIGDTVVTYYM